MSVISPCAGCMLGNHDEHVSSTKSNPDVIDGTYCDCTGNCTVYKPGWLINAFDRAQYNIRNRETSAEQAWQEGYQAGLWYGKSGEATANPYHFKESLGD